MAKRSSPTITGYAGHDVVEFGDKRTVKADPVTEWLTVTNDQPSSRAHGALNIDLIRKYIPEAVLGDKVMVIYPQDADISASNSAEFAKLIHAAYTRGSISLIPSADFDYNRRMKIEDAILMEWEKAGVRPGASVSEGQLASMVGIAVRLCNNHLTSSVIIDPVSKLKLPPESGTRPKFVDRGRDPETGKRITIQRFLETVWADYTSRHLLFSGELRQIDEHAYQAIRYQIREAAAKYGKHFDEVAPEMFFSFGILTTEHLTNPPKGYERQAGLLRQAYALKRSNSYRSSATALAADVDVDVDKTTS
jgi:hypothetical protein